MIFWLLQPTSYLWSVECWHLLSSGPTEWMHRLQLFSSQAHTSFLALAICYLSKAKKKNLSFVLFNAWFNACPQKGMSHTNKRCPREEPHSCCCDKFCHTCMRTSNFTKSKCCSLLATYLILFPFHSSVLLSFSLSLLLNWMLGGK